jgi:hypothetical protein
MDFDTLLAFSLGELGEQGAKEVAQHAGQCERCQRELQAMKSLTSELARLPEVMPDDRAFFSLRERIERRQAAPAAVLLWMFNFMRRPLTMAATIFLVVALAAFSLMRSHRAPDPAREAAVAEMGSKIARWDMKDGELSDALHSYLSDIGHAVTEALHCSSLPGEDCWRNLKAEILQKDMIYRALMLRERLSETYGGDRLREPTLETAEFDPMLIIDDSLRILRSINERSPESLVRERDRFKTDIEKTHLVNYIEKGGIR